MAKSTPKKTTNPPLTSAPPTQKTHSNTYLWVILGVILLVTLLAYLPALRNQFVNWDDAGYVYKNPYLTDPSPQNTKKLLTQDIMINFHPLTMLSYKLNYDAGKLNPYPYHLTNILFHLLNTLLVFLFAYHLTHKKPIVAITTTLLFALHPMHVESVAWVSERKDVLYVCFFILGLLAYLRYSEKYDRKWLLITFLCFILSLLSKAMAVVFPIVLLLIDYYKQRILAPNTSSNLPKALIEKIPFFILSLIMGYISVKIQSTSAINEFSTFPIHWRFMFACYGYIMYLVKIILPIQLSAFYPYPTLTATGSLPIYFYIIPFVLLGVAVGIVWWFRNNRSLIFGILFYSVTVALVLQFISVGKVIIADRYTYLPYVGIGITLGIFADYLWQQLSASKSSLRWALPILALLCTGWWSYATAQQCKVWYDGVSLWTNVIKLYPKEAQGYVHRGNWYGDNGNVKSALPDFEMALKLGNREAETYKSLGNCYGTFQQFDKSIEAFNTAISLDSTDFTYYLNRAVTYVAQKNFAAALTDLTSALSKTKIDTDKPQILSTRGSVYYDSGNIALGVADFEALLKIKPNDASTHYLLAKGLYALGNIPQATQHAKQARSLGAKTDAAFMQQLGL
jgi:Flp pilus assembly protein TadD